MKEEDIISFQMNAMISIKSKYDSFYLIFKARCNFDDVKKKKRKHFVMQKFAKNVMKFL